MSKKSFLERIGIIRSIDEESMPQLIDLDEPEELMSEEKKWIRDVLIANTEREGKVTFIVDPTTMLAGRGNASDVNAEQYTSVEDIYDMYRKETGGASTIFVVDEFAGALPETLNFQKKRQAILNLLKTAGVNVNDLIADGLARVECLSGYLTTFKKKTDDIQAEHDAQIEELEERIAELKETGNERRVLQDKQENVIEQEIFKIKALLDFVTRKG